MCSTCYNYNSYNFYTLLFYSLMLMYKACISYLVHLQTATAIWSGNFLVFSYILGGNWSGIVKGQSCFVLFCFGAIVVYITPTKLRNYCLQILSALLQNWIFLSGSCHHLMRSCVFYLLQLQFLQLVHSIYKDIRSGH